MNVSGSDFAWIVIGIPAVLAWLAYGLCWLLEPRLAAEVSPIMWAGYAASGWYILMALILSASSANRFLW